MVLPKGANIHPRAVCLGTLEPQLLQNALPKVLGGERLYSPLLFFPESHENCSGFTKRLVAKALQLLYGILSIDTFQKTHKDHAFPMIYFHKGIPHLIFS